MESIAIGITTRNRPEILDLSLKHFAHFQSSNTKYVVVEDHAFPYKACDEIIKKYSQELDITFIKSKKRLGIATAKNTCLHYLSEFNEVFLFDDDAWPMRNNWAESWIQTERANSVGHSMFIFGPPYKENCELNFSIVATIGQEPHLMDAWNACMGVALHFSRQCLNEIGGYDSYSALSNYGYEHAQISVRSAQAGFTKGHRYLAPRNIKDLIYSVDITHNIFHIPVPLTGKMIPGFHSSVSAVEIDNARKNAQMMENPKIKIPIDTKLIP